MKKTPAKAAATTKPPVQADANMVRRCLEFAAVNDPRFYLEGVCIQPSKSGGVLIIASDGCTMLVLHDPCGRADKETVLPLSKRAHKAALGAKDTEYVFVDANGRVWFGDLFGLATYVVARKPIEAKYPDFIRAIPPLDDLAEGLGGAYQPAFLRRLLDDDAASKYAGIRFYRSKTSDRDDRVLLARVKDGLACVMPLRDDDTLKNLPSDFRRVELGPAPAASEGEG